MPRRKQYKISASQTAIYDVIVAELQRNPELADYDMGTIEISIKKKNYPIQWSKNNRKLFGIFWMGRASKKRKLSD